MKWLERRPVCSLILIQNDSQLCIRWPVLAAPLWGPIQAACHCPRAQGGGSSGRASRAHTSSSHNGGQMGSTAPYWRREVARSKTDTDTREPRRPLEGAHDLGPLEDPCWADGPNTTPSPVAEAHASTLLANGSWRYSLCLAIVRTAMLAAAMTL